MRFLRTLGKMFRWGIRRDVFAFDLGIILLTILIYGVEEQVRMDVHRWGGWLYLVWISGIVLFSIEFTRWRGSPPTEIKQARRIALTVTGVFLGMSMFNLLVSSLLP